MYKTLFDEQGAPLEINILEDYNESYCPATNAFHLLSGKWKIPILYLLMSGTKRYSELRKTLSGITEKMLAQRLDELEDDGIISRAVFAETPPRVEYTLTEYGKTLQHVFVALIDWGSKHVVVETAN